MRPRLYLAGPEVFLPDALEIGRQKRALCAQHGFEGIYPFDLEPGPRPTPRETGLAIYAANRDTLRSCHALMANLTPFRGPSADPGTVFELGMMAGLGRPVFGYTNAAGSMTERTRAACPGAAFAPARGSWLDRDGLAIEAFDLLDNLMIDGALADTGAPFRSSPSPPGQAYRDLAGFASCLAAARAWFDEQPAWRQSSDKNGSALR